jgi:antitoxin component of MazEF toxin-antitoxin module
MVTTLSNFGDYFGVQFPKSFLERVSIFENDDVEVSVMENSIIIKRLERKKHLTTKERIVAFSETAELPLLSETDWGEPQGKEVW